MAFCRTFAGPPAFGLVRIPGGNPSAKTGENEAIHTFQGRHLNPFNLSGDVVLTTPYAVEDGGQKSGLGEPNALTACNCSVGGKSSVLRIYLSQPLVLFLSFLRPPDFRYQKPPIDHVMNSLPTFKQSPLATCLPTRLESPLTMMT